MDDEVLTQIRDRVESSAFHRWIGMSVAEAALGEVTVTLDARPEHANLQGLIHGGLLATLADTSMGLAVRTQVDPGRRHVTIQLGINYLRPGRPGGLEARGRALRVGNRVAYAEADILDESGRLLARAHGTYSVTEAPEG
jgi:uncharacterized protein (TIGR00369 family)